MDNNEKFSFNKMYHGNNNKNKIKSQNKYSLKTIQKMIDIKNFKSYSQIAKQKPTSLAQQSVKTRKEMEIE